MRKNQLLTFVAGALLAVTLQPFVTWAQVVGIPRFVQNLTVRGTFTADTADSRFDSIGVGTAALGTTGTLAVAGAASVGGLSDFNDNGTDATIRVNASGGIQVTGDCGNGTYNTTAGAGIEVCETSGEASIQAYNRNSSGYVPLRLSASSVYFALNGAASPGVDLTPVSGTFALNWDSACGTTPVTTVDYQRVGNLVTLIFASNSGFPCTGDTTAFATSAADVPAAIRPTTTYVSPIHDSGLDNGASVLWTAQINSSGTVQLADCGAVFTAICSTATWNASGNRQVPTNHSFSYMLGNP